MGSLFRNVDASWFRMDDPTNLMVVTGVLVLDAPVPVARIRELLEKRLLRFHRFRCRVVPPVGGVGLPSWEPDPDFSIDRHLTVVRLGPGAGDPALQAFVSEQLSEPFPEGRPIWSIHFIEHFGGGSALVARILFIAVRRLSSRMPASTAPLAASMATTLLSATLLT